LISTEKINNITAAAAKTTISDTNIFLIMSSSEIISQMPSKAMIVKTSTRISRKYEITFLIELLMMIWFGYTIVRRYKDKS